MPDKAIADKIDFNKSEQYILSIRLGTDGFSFSIYNPIRDCVIYALEREMQQELSLMGNLKEMFKALPFLSYVYKQVNVIVTTRRFTLIPQELFVADQAETYFYYNYSPNKNEVILHNSLTKNGAVVPYAVDKSMHSFLCAQYAQIEFYASVSAWATTFAVKSRLGSAKKMYVSVSSGFMELYGYDRGHLVLLNSYECKSPSDCTYYILYAWKQLAMDQQADELCITGIEENHKLVEDLQRFVRHISILNLSVNELYK